MNTYKLNNTVVELETLNYLSSRTGERFSQRDLAKALKVTPSAMTNTIKRLNEKELIVVEPTKSINFISYNRENLEAIERKRAENLRQIYQSKLLRKLEEELPGATIILFGSYAKGEDTKGSDIDIAIIGRKRKTLHLEPYEELLNRNISVNFYDGCKDIHKHLKNNILNGITLQGSVEL